MKFFILNNKNQFNLSSSRIEQDYATSIANSLVSFYKDDKLHNTKNAALFSKCGKKSFFLKDKMYFTNFCTKDNPFVSINNIFNEKITKIYWRKFIKLQVFL